MAAIGNFCFIGRFLKIFFSVTTWVNEVKFYRKHLWNVIYKIPHFIPIGQKTWSPWAILVSDLLKCKKIFSSETRRHNELLLCRNDSMGASVQMKFKNSSLKLENNELLLSVCRNDSMGDPVQNFHIPCRSYN